MHKRTQLESTSEREEGLPAGYADDLMAGNGDIESGTGRRTKETDATTSRTDVRDIDGVENDASDVDKDDGDNLECYDLRAARNKVYRLESLDAGLL